MGERNKMSEMQGKKLKVRKCKAIVGCAYINSRDPQRMHIQKTVLLVHFKAHVCPKFTHQILAQAQVRG
jgi:hypothetical protein